MSNASTMLSVPVAPLLATGGGVPAALALATLSGLADARSQQLNPNVTQFSQEGLVNLAISSIPGAPPIVQSLAAPMINSAIDYYQAEDAAYDNSPSMVCR